MIIAGLNGGLGNQMFQYANARALAARKGVDFLIDASAYQWKNTHQGSEITHIFDLPAGLATKHDLARVIGPWMSPALCRLFYSRPFVGKLQKQWVSEPHFQYWDGLEQCPNDSYLFGYWQSEKYFSDLQTLIRQDFRFRPFVDAQNIEMAAQIQGVKSAVSMHIRRGDFVKNPKAYAYHGVCPPDYYLRALNFLREQGQASELFIFSDDLEWVKFNIDLQDYKTHYVDHNRGANSYQDMALMSLCKHNIIANSSFSWWGAWLNASSDKIVIAPQNWFAKPINTRDLIPASWMRM